MNHFVPIAIIEDDSEMLRVLSHFLFRNGIETNIFSDPRKAVASFKDTPYGVVITDVQMPGISGLEILEQVKTQLPGAITIMITGFGSVPSAVEAMKKGAFDYISKPFDYEEFLIVVQKAIEQYSLRQEINQLRKSVQQRYAFGNIIGKSPAMQRIFDVFERIMYTRTNILIEGESGTGKELVAKAIHYSGPRKNKPFIAINCGALPETLLESELFGHEKGAYTGAVTQEQGLLASADTGTVFLDEIEDMPMSMQSKLLRVLEDWEIRPVGGSTIRKIDVCVISASKSNLAELVDKGLFREDLYYRLNVVSIHLPLLKERPEDIPLLVDHFLTRYSKENDTKLFSITRDVLEAFLQYSWPGNIRELEHVLERAMILAQDLEITLADLPQNILNSVRKEKAAKELQDERVSLQDIEKDHITKVLEEVDWHRTKASQILGINRRTLYRKILEYGIKER